MDKYINNLLKHKIIVTRNSERSSENHMKKCKHASISIASNAYLFSNLMFNTKLLINFLFHLYPKSSFLLPFKNNSGTQGINFKNKLYLTSFPSIYLINFFHLFLFQGKLLPHSKGWCDVYPSWTQLELKAMFVLDYVQDKLNHQIRNIRSNFCICN